MAHSFVELHGNHIHWRNSRISIIFALLLDTAKKHYPPLHPILYEACHYNLQYAIVCDVELDTVIVDKKSKLDFAKLISATKEEVSKCGETCGGAFLNQIVLEGPDAGYTDVATETLETWLDELSGLVDSISFEHVNADSSYPETGNDAQ